MSLLRRLLHKPEPDVPRDGPVDAFAGILLRSRERFNPDPVRRVANRVADGFAKMTHWDIDGAVSLGRMPGTTLSFVLIPRPLATDDLDGPASHAWHWPDAAAAVAEHTAHVMVRVQSTVLSAIDAHLLLTRTVGEILELVDAVGVWVPDALLLRAPGQYRVDAQEASRQNPPVLSWMGIQLIADTGGASALTTGLESFGFAELEVQRTTQDPREVAVVLANVGHHLLSGGGVPTDGSTISVGESVQTRVRYRKSKFRPDSTVLLLELPTASG